MTLPLRPDEVQWRCGVEIFRPGFVKEDHCVLNEHVLARRYIGQQTRKLLARGSVIEVIKQDVESGPAPSTKRSPPAPAIVGLTPESQRNSERLGEVTNGDSPGCLGDPAVPSPALGADYSSIANTQLLTIFSWRS
jgi:hypothetical protein